MNISLNGQTANGEHWAGDTLGEESGVAFVPLVKNLCRAKAQRAPRETMGPGHAPHRKVTAAKGKV